MAIAKRFGPLGLCAMILLGSAALASAQTDAGPPVPIAEAKIKTGAVRVTLSERSPLSSLKDIAKRVGLKPAETGDDYNLANETFYIYLPKDPGDDGKYGLMVGLCFKEYGHPATAWPDVLEKKHLIWIGAEKNGDERSQPQRIGLLLDAVNSSQKTWSIDPDRVYLSMNAGKGAALGTALYYPDIFAGMLGSYAAHWFVKLPGYEHPPSTWNVDDFPRPAGKYLDLAKAQSRIFQANRDDGVGHGTTNDLIQKKGFGAAGFKYVKFIKVPEADMGHYINYSADWFEQGIDFLDAPLAKIRAAHRPHAKPAVMPLKPPAS